MLVTLNRVLEYAEANNQAIGAFNAILDYIVGDRALDFNYVTEGCFFEDENVKITAIPTRHCLPRPSFAYLVEADGKRVLFTGDLRGDLSDMPAIATAEKLDVVICEAAHNRLDKASDILYALNTDMLIINHISPKNPESISTPFAQNAPFKCVISNDNDIIEV